MRSLSWIFDMPRLFLLVSRKRQIRVGIFDWKLIRPQNPDPRLIAVHRKTPGVIGLAKIKC
jgi:hypothetical protein